MPQLVVKGDKNIKRMSCRLFLDGEEHPITLSKGEPVIFDLINGPHQVLFVTDRAGDVQNETGGPGTMIMQGSLAIESTKGFENFSAMVANEDIVYIYLENKSSLIIRILISSLTDLADVLGIAQERQVTADIPDVPKKKRVKRGSRFSFPWWILWIFPAFLPAAGLLIGPFMLLREKKHTVFGIICLIIGIATAGFSFYIIGDYVGLFGK